MRRRNREPGGRPGTAAVQLAGIPAGDGQDRGRRAAMGGPERLHVRGESVLGQVPQGREDGAEPGRRNDRIAPLDRVPVAEGRPQETETEEVPVEGRGAPRTEVNPADHEPRVRREY